MESYASLAQCGEMDDHSVLIRVVEPSSAKWSHIPNLDSFFTRIYNYHQKQGFATIFLSTFFSLFNYVFICCVTVLMFKCVDYNFLYHWNTHRTEPFHVFCPLNECLTDFSTISLVIIFIAIVVWIIFFLRALKEISHTLYIKQFYNSALRISSNELSNLTWNEVLDKVRAAQLKERMCINVKDLSQLDIYNRILREENYFVALVNKKLLPPRFQVPFIGEVIFWTPTIRYMMGMLLFSGPFSFFKNPFELKDELKNRTSTIKSEFIGRFRKIVTFTAIFTILCLPFVFCYEVVQTFLMYFEVLRKDPRSLGARKWSDYGRLYLRHFNELDHELNSRLSRAYRPATRYLSTFSSPIVGVIAGQFAFIFGSISAILTIMSLIDGELLIVEVFYIALFGMLFTVCSSFKPDETLAWNPEPLLAAVVECIHYLPTDWQGQAHTTKVRNEFEQLFHLSITAVIQRVLTVIMLPYILFFWLRPRSTEFMEFFRSFTISVDGVGDICSFALMDIKRHGNAQWQNNSRTKTVNVDQVHQAEDGKTELSLIHFTQTNPDWSPPKEVENFVSNVKLETSNLTATRTEASLSSTHFGLQPLPVHNILSESWYGSRSRMEGLSDPNCMGASAIYLHNVSHRNVGSYYQPSPTPAQESTPLLWQKQ